MLSNLGNPNYDSPRSTQTSCVNKKSILGDFRLKKNCIYMNPSLGDILAHYSVYFTVARFSLSLILEQAVREIKNPVRVKLVSPIIAAEPNGINHPAFQLSFSIDDATSSWTNFSCLFDRRVVVCYRLSREGWGRKSARSTQMHFACLLFPATNCHVISTTAGRQGYYILLHVGAMWCGFSLPFLNAKQFSSINFNIFIV